MDNFKALLIKIGIQEMGPSAIRGAILGIAAWLLARNDLLVRFGIVSDAVAQTTTIHWPQLSLALIAGLPAALAFLIKGVQFHGTNIIGGSSDGSKNQAVEPPKGSV